MWIQPYFFLNFFLLLLSPSSIFCQKTFFRQHIFKRSPQEEVKNIPHKERHVKETQFSSTNGHIRGFKKSNLGREVYVYYGIPYAEPPVGELRFKKPVGVKNWTGKLDATQLPNSCVQEKYQSFPNFQGEEMWNPNTNISEDCLYLNLWVPKKAVEQLRAHSKKNSTDLLKGFPILIWIYGGGYMAGTSTLDIYNADILASENDVIVASMNYRVGAFGFLYFGIDDAPGNQGMYDQMLAMKWIKDNAGKFGGDPESITLFGESAGGGSVSFHMLSPLSRNLMTRGILQSGTLNAPWSVKNASEAKDIAIKLANDCQCNGTNSYEKAVECLRRMPASKISELQWMSYKSILDFPSAPTIDGEFLPRHPVDMLKDGDFKRTELLIGSNKNEGTFFMLYDFLSYFNREKASCLEREQFLEIIGLMFPSRSALEREAILFQYTHWEDIGDECKNADLLNELAGDYFFICPSNYFAQAFADHNLPVFYYFFTQRTSSNPWGDWMGVIHGEEVEYVFGQPLKFTNNHTKAESVLSQRVMKYFVRFAATGSPVSGVEDEETWPLHSRHEQNYFILNAESKGTGKGPRAQACAFWNEFMPLITPGTSSLRNRCSRERWEFNSSAATTTSSTIFSLINTLFSFLIILLTSTTNIS